MTCQNSVKFVYADRLEDVLFMNAQSDNLIEVRNMNFTRGSRRSSLRSILLYQEEKWLRLWALQGLVKQPLLRLMGGQILPDSGEIWFDGNIPALSRSALYQARKENEYAFSIRRTVYRHECLKMWHFHKRAYKFTWSIDPYNADDETRPWVYVVQQFNPFWIIRRHGEKGGISKSDCADPNWLCLMSHLLGKIHHQGVLIKLIDELNRALGVTCAVVSRDVLFLKYCRLRLYCCRAESHCSRWRTRITGQSK